MEDRFPLLQRSTQQGRHADGRGLYRVDFERRTPALVSDKSQPNSKKECVLTEKSDISHAKFAVEPTPHGHGPPEYLCSFVHDVNTMHAIHPSTDPMSSPSLLLLGAEPWRAAVEFVGMKTMDKSVLPSGDGHAVVIFPGLATDHQAVAPLKRFCMGLGYDAFDWGRGMNTGPKGDVDAWLDGLTHDVADMTKSHDTPISLVGWSLGGIYAREVAKRLPKRTRQVITIGTPFAGSPEHTRARWIYRLLNGRKPPLNKALAQRLAVPPKVPTTSIFSRTDGVVAWQACIQGGGERHCENIEVKGSHCGLVWNSEVYKVVADRLRQTPGQWQPMG